MAKRPAARYKIDRRLGENIWGRDALKKRGYIRLNTQLKSNRRDRRLIAAVSIKIGRRVAAPGRVIQFMIEEALVAFKREPNLRRILLGKYGFLAWTPDRPLSPGVAFTLHSQRGWYTFEAVGGGEGSGGGDEEDDWKGPRVSP